MIQASNPNHIERVERIRNAVGKEDRKWLNGILKYSGEPRLEQRILEVLSSLPIGFNEKELKHFANQCATERNLISHSGGRRDENDYEKHLNIWFTLLQALEPLYHATILQELGFSKAAIHHLFWDIYPSIRIRRALTKNNLNIFKLKD
jgi:hypothetical protein